MGEIDSKNLKGRVEFVKGGGETCVAAAEDRKGEQGRGGRKRERERVTGERVRRRR